MRVLVTGSEGFLGKHVCAALMGRGHVVTGLDCVPGANLVADITKVMPLMQVDAVVHLAAVASPNICGQNPEMGFNVNVQGTHQVLRLAMESGAKKFVFSSSAHVYGVGPKYLPTDEAHPLWLQNTYTTTKILGEQLCHLFYENHGLSYTTLRLYNAYGPGQGAGYFVPDMIAKTPRGYVELKGSNTTKDFVYVSDVARAFVLAVGTAYVGPVNIGTGVETPLEDVARFLMAKTTTSLGIIPISNATRMQADNRRAKQVLGWEPTVGIWEGLRATLDHAKKRPLVSQP